MGKLVQVSPASGRKEPFEIRDFNLVSSDKIAMEAFNRADMTRGECGGAETGEIVALVGMVVLLLNNMGRRRARQGKVPAKGTLARTAVLGRLCGFRYYHGRPGDHISTEISDPAGDRLTSRPYTYKHAPPE